MPSIGSKTEGFRLYMMKTISFIIPCYQSEHTVAIVIDDILRKMAERPEYNYEIVAVNDCSPDRVIDVLLSLAEKDEQIKVIDLAGNVGKHTAVLVGYRYATGDYMVSLDDDGQCPIDCLWELIRPLEEGHDMAMAKYARKNESGLKRMGSRINHRVSQILLEKPRDLQFTNFIARQKYICKAMAKYKNIFPYLEGLSLRITRDIVLVPMEEMPRISGKSSFTFAKSLALWMNGFTAFSVKPLRIGTLIGAITAMLGFLYGVITIIRKIVIRNISVGYSSLLVAILFCSGLIMLMLGLAGEYIGRIYLSVNRYPQYVVKQARNVPEAGEEPLYSYDESSVSIR